MVAACLALAGTLAFAEGVDSNDPALRTQQGLSPSKNLLFNGWGLTPAGEQVPISDLPLKMVVSPDGRMLAAVSGGYANTGLTLVDIATGRKSQFLPLQEAWNGLAFSNDGTRIFVSCGDKGEIHVFHYADGKAGDEQIVKPAPRAKPVFLAGIAVRPDTGKVYVCNEANHEVWVLNADTLALEAKVAVGMHPHSCVMGADKRHLYVSNWGSRTVSVIDTDTNQLVRDLTVGLRPNDMALSSDGRLFVACSGDNTVQVINTDVLEKQVPLPNRKRRLYEGSREVLCTSLYPQSPEGSTPDAVAVSPDGNTLYVANADNNDVMVVDISNDSEHPGYSLVSGFIPTGWYPSALAVSQDSKTIFVGVGKGGSRPNSPPITDKPRGKSQHAFDYIARCFSGSVSIVAAPTAAELADYTDQVRRNCPYRPEYMRQTPLKTDSIIPDKVGDPCPIKYVLYIIKENRTYDQILGDFHDACGKPAGNGDPDLVMYGEKVTANQHQIARDYVLLDNLYCNGEVSADGHSWCDAAIATDYNERRWIMTYSKHGLLPGNDEMATPAAGYLWDLCKRHGVSFHNYGEGSQRVTSEDRTVWQGRDMQKADTWIADLHEAEKKGGMPQLHHHVAW